MNLNKLEANMVISGLLRCSHPNNVKEDFYLQTHYIMILSYLVFVHFAEVKPNSPLVLTDVSFSTS